MSTSQPLGFYCIATQFLHCAEKATSQWGLGGESDQSEDEKQGAAASKSMLVSAASPGFVPKVAVCDICLVRSEVTA